MASYKRMTVKDWVTVADNPIQRDTEKHAAKARHLKTFHPTHAFVFAAELPNGKLVKLDGHTRALMWKRGDVPGPHEVVVGIVQAKDMEEVEKLYKDFDSSDALETMRDKVSGAFKRFNFDPQSGLLQAGSLTFALRVAYGILLGLSATAATSGSRKESTKGQRTAKVEKKNSIDVYGMINEFSYELNALDGFGLASGQASAGVLAAFLVSYRKYGHRITPFWRGVFSREGTKARGQMDAIQALCELIMDRKGRYGGQAASDMCARSLMAVEKWTKDETLSSMPRPMDTTNYLVGHEKPTERLIKKHDIGKKSA